MKRLTTDTPKDNMEMARNLFYVRDGWVWIRGGGPAPEYEDISLCDYVRKIARDHKLEMGLSSDDYEVSDAMTELFIDESDTIEGIVATLYTAGWAFAEIRQRLKAYEDTGLSPDEVTRVVKRKLNPLEVFDVCAVLSLWGPEWGCSKLRSSAPVIAPPPSAPLTLEELREMEGVPVWIVGVSCVNDFNGHHDIVHWEGENRIVFPYCMEEPDLDLIGINWQAYRFKPEETDGLAVDASENAFPAGPDISVNGDESHE